jgi:hypothetical protein
MTIARAAVVAAVALASVLGGATAHAVPKTDCGGVLGSSCGVQAESGEFHGLLAVGGSPWVFAAATHSGTRPGCGDCTWSIVLACATNSPGGPGGTARCAPAANSPTCQPQQLLFRVYLTTDAVIDVIEGTVCIGGPDQPIGVSDVADANVKRYLKNAIPPSLRIATRPKAATLAGLITYFTARLPATLRPTRLSGSGITETITIAPSKADWRWGDASTSGWTSSTTTLTHSYVHGGVAHGSVTTRWGATYTITYQGQTLGPYDATGQLRKRQLFTLPVRTSSPILVSN